MAREKFGTLTEQMFYILLCLQTECCGMDIMARVGEMTAGRVAVGPGTLYHLLDDFVSAGMIVETDPLGRRRNYVITKAGREALAGEAGRLENQLADFRRFHRPEEETS